MRYLIILSLIVIATASPTRNTTNEENAKTETDESTSDSKVEISFERIKNGLPKIIVDIKDKEDNKNKDPAIEGKDVEGLTEEKDDLNANESGEIEVGSAEEKSESRSTIYVHTPSASQVSVAPNKRPLPSKYNAGSRQSAYGQLQPQPYDARKKKKEDKPYNQVNVYVYFPQDMMDNGMGMDNEMSVNQYNYDDGTSSSMTVSNSRPQQQKKQECPVGFARIKGVCLEIDNRKKRVLSKFNYSRP